MTDPISTTELVTLKCPHCGAAISSVAVTDLELLDAQHPVKAYYCEACRAILSIESNPKRAMEPSK